MKSADPRAISAEVYVYQAVAIANFEPEAREGVLMFQSLGGQCGVLNTDGDRGRPDCNDFNDSETAANGRTGRPSTEATDRDAPADSASDGASGCPSQAAGRGEEEAGDPRGATSGVHRRHEGYGQRPGRIDRRVSSDDLGTTRAAQGVGTGSGANRRKRNGPRANGDAHSRHGTVHQAFDASFISGDRRQMKAGVAKRILGQAC